MSLAMTKAQREAFLAETRVGIISIAEEGRGPLTLPIWYTYTPGGDVQIAMGGASTKANLIRQAGRCSLCVQTETPPYQYVSVEGPATIGDQPDYETIIKPMAYRYLGEQMGEMYLQTTADERAGSVLVTLQTKRWLTVDYNKMVEEANA